MVNEIKLFFNRPLNILVSKAERIFLILFCGVFVYLFLFIFNPFKMSEWKFSLPFANELPLVTYSIIGMLLLSITQFSLRKWLKLDHLNVRNFILLLIFEVLFLTLFFFMIYRDDDIPLWEEYFITLRLTFLILCIPYAFAMILLFLWNLKVKYQASQKALERKVINPLVQLQLKDENDKVLLSLSPDQIVLLKSEGNYVLVYFLKGDKLQKKLIRTYLKKIEQELEHESLFRIHRSYMVNLKQVSAVDRNKRSFSLHLKHLPELSIPVSSSFKTPFEEKMGLASTS